MAITREPVEAALAIDARVAPALPTIAIHPWPAPDGLPQPVDGIVVLAVQTAAEATRDQIRLQVRTAVCEVLAALLSVPLADISLPRADGAAPRIVLRDGRTHAARYSISHETGLSLAAINLHGSIGVDLMRVHDITDWEIVARDYLGGAVATQLAATATALRARAFAQAWTAREASLKCAGLGLHEWQGPLNGTCRVVALELGADLVGTLASA